MTSAEKRLFSWLRFKSTLEWGKPWERIQHKRRQSSCFLVAFTFIAGGLAADVSWLLMIVGLALLGVSIGLFLKCKPWEQQEQ